VWLQAGDPFVMELSFYFIELLLPLNLRVELEVVLHIRCLPVLQLILHS